MLLQRGVTTSLPWFWDVQRHIYFAGARNIWPAQPACVEFDEQLVYRPRLGTCRFDNPEFRTVQTFAADGRRTGPKPPGVGIAVVGDSQGMGWGVNDEETFSAELQRLSGRPVYNLAVSSYGTARELQRLERSGVLNHVDTVLIQYCENDLEENVAFGPMSVGEARRKYESIGHAASGRKSALGSLAYLSDGYAFALRLPFTSLKELAFGTQVLDFADHYPPFIAAIRKHVALRHTRILAFYVNSYGAPFLGFPVGRDPQLSNVEFLELGLGRADYYPVDGHLTREGHRKAGRRLFDVLGLGPRPETGALKH
jgi:hypothetical protein